MAHPIHKVTSFERFAAFTLRVRFEDGTVQVIDFRPVLYGELYGPLADSAVFDRVVLDEEAHTLVWPNGVAFDPATLHDWPTAGRALAALAEKWRRAAVPPSS